MATSHIAGWVAVGVAGVVGSLALSRGLRWGRLWLRRHKFRADCVVVGFNTDEQRMLARVVVEQLEGVGVQARAEQVPAPTDDDDDDVGPTPGTVLFRLYPGLGAAEAVSYCLLSLYATAPLLPRVSALTDLIPRRVALPGEDAPPRLPGSEPDADGHPGSSPPPEYDMLSLTICKPFMDTLVAECRKRLESARATLLVAFSEDVVAIAGVVAGACGLRLLVVRDTSRFSHSAGLVLSKTCIDNSSSRCQGKTIECNLEGLRPDDVAVVLSAVSNSGGTKGAVKSLLIGHCRALYELVLLDVAAQDGRPGSVHGGILQVVQM